VIELVVSTVTLQDMQVKCNQGKLPYVLCFPDSLKLEEADVHRYLAYRQLFISLVQITLTI
jgi:hypothetical protein